MRFVIYGAGAVGGAIGGRLFQHGHETVLIARGAHLAAIREHGLRLQSPSGPATLRVPAAGHPREIEFRRDDAVFLTMKTQDTEAALADLEQAAGPDVAVVCAQNGVENERLALRRFRRVYGMLVILPATLVEAGVVEATSAPTTGILDAGRYPRGSDSFIAAVTAALESATFSARAQPEVMRWKYGKLLTNLGNALQACCGLDARGGDILSRALSEALACYRAAGIDWAGEEEMRARRAGLVGFRQGQGSSTWQSLAREAGSVEADYLNGEVSLLGRLRGLPTPVNDALRAAANRLARERLPPESMSLDEMRTAIERCAAGDPG